MVGINPGDKVMSQVLVTKRDEVSRAKRAELKRKKKNQRSCCSHSFVYRQLCLD